MGTTTDFIGFVEISPPLNASEQAYLTAFAQSRRHDRPGGPYEVPDNPAAENREPVTGVDHDAYNRPGDGQPSLWCQWVPALDGACLSFNGCEKFYGAAAWMRYLIDHFLAPDALARDSPTPLLAAFSFNHVADGMIAASQRDSGELYAIHVEDNVVTTESLWVPRSLRDGLMPYEVALDDERAERDRWS
ncbi:hypothetical protein [uncultured Jatrophihabitans sp.]|uniref:hypothetical protein n=1 Tax=uncultured Jatrophihabitans sp. TaxID=1610747 RepID=UPI0035CA8A0F